MTREEALQAIKAKMDYYENDKRLRAAIETLIPELAESEDERVRKTLIEALTVSKSMGELKFRLPEPTREECITWLEKQKDFDKMIVVSPEVWDNAVSDAFENGKKEGEKQKESENVSATTMIPSCWTEKQKEQKPAEGDYETEIQKAFREGKSAGRKEVFDHPEEYGLQKSAEWSKNDIVFLNEITDFFENKTVRLQHDIDMYAHWLKSLPERFSLQPKLEWSEEDEKMRWNLINAFTDKNNSKVDEFMGLRASKAEILDFLKSLRPSWKPSEEVMKALKECGECKRCIKKLYEDLQKRYGTC